MRGPGVLYVGNLPEGIRESELHDLFDKVRPDADAASPLAAPPWPPI
jgi:hypothetical protein